MLTHSELNQFQDMDNIDWFRKFIKGEFEKYTDKPGYYVRFNHISDIDLFTRRFKHNVDYLNGETISPYSLFVLDDRMRKIEMVHRQQKINIILELI